MANENNNKIPCGGFYLGDGLTMDGNTLKSLGGGKYRPTGIRMIPRRRIISRIVPADTRQALKSLGMAIRLVG